MDITLVIVWDESDANHLIGALTNPPTEEKKAELCTLYRAELEYDGIWDEDTEDRRILSFKTVQADTDNLTQIW